MFLRHGSGARKRRMMSAMLFAAAATWFAGAGAATAWASPQTGSGSGSSTSPRRACAGCRTEDESARLAREKLLMRIDSMKWQFDHARLSRSEREQLAEEMTRVLAALQESLGEIARTRSALAAARAEASGLSGAAPVAVGMAAEGAFRRPRGYLGVTFDAPMIEMARDNERVVRFYQYPRIALVEPSSPAERAGVLEGDTLLSLNGNDVKEREVSFTRLLVPNARIVMRVKREGNEKDLKVTVGVAPDYYASRIVAMRAPPAMEPPPVPSAPPVPPMPADVRVRVMTPPMPAMVEAGPASVWIVSEGIAGAKVETLSEGLGKAVGASAGVLILKSSPATPAYRSGLRDGDVVLRAAGEPVASVRELRMLVQNADREEGIRLVILRERKRRELTLRW